METGLRQLLRTKFFRFLLVIAWASGVAAATAGFVFAQSVSSGGWIETFAAQLGPRPQAIGSAACAMILLYPDICITGLYSGVFWVHSFVGLGLSLLALTVVIPRLVARDRANNALTIYLSRPLTSTDYLLGKLGLIIGILLLVWTGPLLCGWLLSMLFAPGRDFLVYSFSPLLRALLFNGLGLVALAAIALGVSSLGRTTRNTTFLWIGVWIIAGWIANIPAIPNWLRYASFGFDLNQARQAIFRLDEILARAANSLPLLDSQMTQRLTQASQHLQADQLAGALVGLALLIVASCIVFFRRLRPE
jgi:hypothetical protein